MDLMLSQVPGFVVGIITGLITGVLTGLWVAKILDRRKRRAQVRQVTASVTKTWSPVPGQPNTRVMTGGYLTIKNNSEWPVRETIVMEPDWLNKLHLPYLGPGREHVESIPDDVLLAARTVDPRVTLQLTDDRDKLWRWTPATNDLSPIPPPIPLHSHAVQWLDKRSPRLFRGLLWRLPKRTRDWLWGYAPEG